MAYINRLTAVIRSAHSRGSYGSQPWFVRLTIVIHTAHGCELISLCRDMNYFLSRERAIPSSRPRNSAKLRKRPMQE